MPQLVGKEVGAIGFGLMGFTWRPKPCPQEQAFEAMRAAIKNGSMLGESYVHTPHTDLAGRQFAHYQHHQSQRLIRYYLRQLLEWR